MVIYVHRAFHCFLFIFLCEPLVLVCALDSSTVLEHTLCIYKAIFRLWNIYSPVR